MKMIRRTSVTSTRGAMLISLRMSNPVGAAMSVGLLCAFRPRLAGSVDLLLGDQPDVLEARLLGHAHDFLDLGVLQAFVGLDHELGRRGPLKELVELRLQLLLRQLL